MLSKITRRVRLLIGTALAITATVVSTGCSTEVEGQAAASASDAVATRAKEALAGLYGTGTSKGPASEGPRAQKGRMIALVIASQQVPTGTKIVKAAREATDAIGWDLTIWDGKYDPAEYQEGIRQAIVQNADAIWVEAIDCPVVKTALEEAKQAGIPVVAHESADCSDIDPDAESYFARSLEFAEGDFLTWARALGEAQAVWLLAHRGKETNVIEFSVPELVVTKALHEGFNAAMEERCPTCKVTTVAVRTSDFGPPLQQKVATALLRNPDAMPSPSSTTTWRLLAGRPE